MAELEAHRVQRFRFASFDGRDDKPRVAKAEEVKPVEPVAPPGPLPLPLQLPAITEKDLQTARADAQAQGYREGYGEAQNKMAKEAAAREESVKTLLEIIANRITIAAETHLDAIKSREDLMGKLVIASAKKIAGDALKRDPYTAVESLIKECMGLIAGANKLTIVVSNALAPGLRQRIDTLRPLLQDFSGELVVEEDEGLLDQDCRVEWGNGYGERNAQAMWSAIEAIIVKTNINTQEK